MSPLTSTDADSRADHAAAEGLEANVLGPGIAQFFVVPWEIIRNTAGEPISVTCKYFDYKGEPVGAQPMTCPHAFFLLTQGAA
ncbi:hypothetical protein [Roseateles chitinivorans]|uniref:hypothetical protein n=1 Tax=Roseateles chitinivorans TaxID=2917965 RepID=UPI003D6649B3